MSSLLKRTWSRMWHHPGHLIWVIIAYFPFLGFMSVPLTGDQKVYLSTSMEMWQRGSWLRPILFGESSYYKPPLQYWATILGWKTAGFNLWGALIPSAICTVLTAWLVGEIARLLHPRRPLNHAGLWFGAALGTATFGMVAQMEIYLVLFYTFAWWAGLKFLAEPLDGCETPSRRSPVWLYLAFGAAGLSALVKSPLYSVFWVVGYLTYLVVVGEWEHLRNKHLYYAWGLGILLGLFWFVVVGLLDTEKFWAAYIMRETWEKKGGNSGTALSIWLALLYYCLPFVLLLVPAIWAIFRRKLRGHVLAFLISWCWLPALFFSLYPYRTKPYLYLLVPAVCLLVDWGYLMGGRSRLFKITSVSVGFLQLAAAIVIAAVLVRAELVPLWVAVGLILAGGFAALCAIRDWMQGLAIASLAGVFFFHSAAVVLGERDIYDLRRVVGQYPAAPVALLDMKKNIWSEVGLLSAAIGKPIKRLYNYNEVADALQAGGIIVLDDEQSIFDVRSLEAKLAGRGDRRSLAEATWVRWGGRKRFPFVDVILHGKNAMESLDGTLREFRLLKLIELPPAMRK